MSLGYVVAFALLTAVSFCMMAVSALEGRSRLAASFGMVTGACLAITIFGLAK